MGSKMLANHTSHDFKFDSYSRRMCAYDGCRIAMAYTNPEKHQVLNDRRYCSIDCLNKQYVGLGYEGAVHLVHQVFGPEHPVTRMIQVMQAELSGLKKDTDYEDRASIGWIKAAENEKRNSRLSEKCL